ncbi:ABC transporter ATP-binding protein/permease [Streptomyces sp. ATCC 21386]|uniref:ABC transporter ATP-binding protein/permease n=1 Tax=Streptomyces sp. ATCC 21386 TaxID=2699428 RepID=UPI001BFF312F|nr:ABC transporter ATP-binding protein [Streptomyces sp. ATCC 21386]
MLTTLLVYARPARRALMASVAAGVVVSACYVGQSLLLTLAVTRGLRGDMTDAVLACCAALAVIPVRAVLVWAREVTAARAAEQVKTELRLRLYRHLLTLGPGYTVRQRTGAVLTTLQDSVEALDRFVSVFLPQVLVSVLGALGILAVLAVIDPPVAVLVAVTAVLAAATPRLLRHRMRRYLTDYMRGWRGLSADYLDAVQGLTTLKAVGAHERFAARLFQGAWDFYRSSLRFTQIATVSAGFVGFFAALGTAAAVGMAAWQYASGDLALSAVFAVLLLSREAFRPVTDLMGAFHAGQAALPAHAAIRELLDAEPAVPDTGTTVVPRTDTPPCVVVDGIRYTYPGQGRPALDDVSLTLEAGTTTAVVGPSGSGKSTLARLLLRFADPDTGTISVDGTDLRELPLADWHSKVAVVSQDVFLFHGTVHENIAFGRADAHPADIETAARAAHAHAFITALPDGYDTVIGERGLRLSGGQRQRLAIARALLADAPLLILDEATSSVDIAAEQAVTEALERLRAGRTVLIIAHRLSTVADADHLVVLTDGRVVEAAEPRQLLSRNGAYTRLVARQREGAA